MAYHKISSMIEKLGPACIEIIPLFKNYMMEVMMKLIKHEFEGLEAFISEAQNRLEKVF